jgi:predicted metal-dependent phosphotriesterase family hydrolase
VTVVRTVLGDVAPGDLGATYMHEHLIIDHPLVVDRFPHISLPSVEEAVGEVSRCAAAGVGAMVDTMPCAAGRNVMKLAEVSRRTGVAVVASTGLHTDKYYAGARWALALGAESLADLFVADLTEGTDRYDYTGPAVERTDHRAGLVKAATTGERPTASEERLLEAVARTHQQTGCPILTHCEDGRGAPAQVEALESWGVDLGKVVLSHTDKVRDQGYHRDLLARGVSLEYDQSLRQDPTEDRWTLDLLEMMAGEGHLPQLMVGTDGARRSLWIELGGSPGLAQLVRLVDETFDAATRRALLVDNPARFLAF